MSEDIILEGVLRLKLDDGLGDGRELSALVFGVDHAQRVLRCWSHGECAERYQAASGAHHQCAGLAGHVGRCGHRREDTERAL